MDKNIEDEVKMIDAHVQGEPEEEIYHVYNVPGGYIVLRQGEVPEDQTATVIDSLPNTEPDTNIPTTPLPTKPQPQPVSNAMISVLLLAMFVPLFCILVQFYMLFNPYTVTVTLLEKSQQLSLQGTLQLGRVLSPITISQSATVPTTGKGHQDAKAATGTITIYNGSNVAQTVNVGIILTGQDGVQVATDESVTIPPNNPPVNGQATVTAHALLANAKGNIAAGDINLALSSDLTVKNLAMFTGGQDERNFQTVAKSDIDNTASPLKANLTQSINGALTGQLKNGEALQVNPCSPTVTPSNQIGQEATQVKVTVSLTCYGIAYNQDMLQAKVTQLLTTQATANLGAGYSILGNPQVNIIQASTQNSKVILSFKAQSAWIYALSSSQQKIIKNLIAGKNTQKATQMLNSLPGIERVSMNFSGIGDDTRIPKNLNNIHLLIFYGI